MALSQVVLHLALCRASVPARANATTIPIHAVVRYSVGQPFLDQVVQAPLGSSDDATVELQLPRGDELITLTDPASGCASHDFVTILPDRPRRIEETLVAGSESNPEPALTMNGTASLSFLAQTKPTLVAFPNGLACDQPVPATLPVTVDTVYDGGAYYLSLLDDGSFATNQPVLAMRLKTASGKPHYIRVPIKPNTLGHGFMRITMNVSDDMVDGVATEAQNVLLCPQMWSTSVL